MTALPIDSVLPQLLHSLNSSNNVVLQAAPGAGKTTRVPLALLDQPWLAGKRIIMLEPRRLAARNAALYMAELIGEPVGQTIGYRTRLDTKITAQTRIEVVTEGILTRILQNDPALEAYGLVIFDEFHERNLQADLGLTLCLESQDALREDLKLLVMSATLDVLPVAALLSDAPLISSEGRSYPIEYIYGQRPELREVPTAVARTVLRALAEQQGDLLVFLPGVREIKFVQEQLVAAQLASNIQILPLFGDLDPRQQERAILPSPAGQRKVVLATAIAETSLTIEGVRVVVDGGLSRVPRFDPRSGMDRLETLAVTQASAVQRAGRAGRLEPGVCYRLWSEQQQSHLLAHAQSEILAADLAPLTLELAQWGVNDPAQLRWLDAPPMAAFTQARELLNRLGALQDNGQISSHGQKMAELGMHPRLAHMVLKGQQIGLGGLACEIAALLGERDILKVADSDLRLRLEQLHSRGKHPQLHYGTRQRVLQTAHRWQKKLRIKSNIESTSEQISKAGLLLAFAYPDRIAQRRPGGEPRYRLANGRGALIHPQDALGGEPYLGVAQLDAGQREARIFLAAPLRQDDLEQHFGEQIEQREHVSWDDQTGAVQAQQQRCLGELVLEEKPWQAADTEQIAAALLDGIRQRGLTVLPWTQELEAWRARVALLSRVEAPSPDGEPWPDLSDQALQDTMENWLAPYLTGMSRLTHLTRLNLKEVLNSLLSWPQQQALEQLAPTHLSVPSGSRVRIDYSTEAPVLAVRLQEIFGLLETPRIAAGRVALTIHLLSPARRPVQVTQDLASFWANTYAEVKKDLKGRYPKHYWPDDPLQAEATHRVRPKQQK